MLIQAVPAKILAGGRNRFIQKNRGVGRHLQVDIQNGRIWTRTSPPSSEDHQMDASSACGTALIDAGAPVGLAFLIFTFMNTMKQERWWANVPESQSSTSTPSSATAASTKCF